jgi:Fur family peroxide stress response transcriptional regulator
MRYDAILEKHHHLYCADSDRIEDYYDEELNKVLEKYFIKKNIPGFEIKEIRLQISGKFDLETHPGNLIKAPANSGPIQPKE